MKLGGNIFFFRTLTCTVKAMPGRRRGGRGDESVPGIKVWSKINVFLFHEKIAVIFREISEKCFYSWVFFHESDLGMTKTVESSEECQRYCQQVSNDSPNFSYFFLSSRVLGFPVHPFRDL